MIDDMGGIEWSSMAHHCPNLNFSWMLCCFMDKNMNGFSSPNTFYTGSWGGVPTHQLTCLERKHTVSFDLHISWHFIQKRMQFSCHFPFYVSAELWVAMDRWLCSVVRDIGWPWALNFWVNLWVRNFMFCKGSGDHHFWPFSMLTLFHVFRPFCWPEIYHYTQ